MNKYKKRNLLHIGSDIGENIMGPEDFAKVANSPQLRKKFAEEILNITEENAFDGIYFVWRNSGCNTVRKIERKS
jgi:hypothetical protein